MEDEEIYIQSLRDAGIDETVIAEMQKQETENPTEDPLEGSAEETPSIIDSLEGDEKEWAESLRAAGIDDTYIEAVLETEKTPEDQRDTFYLPGGGSSVAEYAQSRAQGSVKLNDDSAGIGDFFSDLSAYIEQGYAKAHEFGEAGDLLAGFTDRENVREWQEAAANADKVRVPIEQQNFFKDLDTCRADGGGFGCYVKATFKNPTALVGVGITSLVQMFNKQSLLAAGGALGTGAAVGGGIPGALAASPYAISLMGGTTEALAVFSEALREEMGGNYSDEGVLDLITNPEWMGKTRAHAAKRAIPIMLFDLVTLKVGGSLVSSIGRNSKKFTAIKAGLAGTTLESIGGAGGELAAQITSGEEINWAEVYVEGVAEAFGLGSLSLAKQAAFSPKYTVNGSRQTYNGVRDVVENGTSQEITDANIEIKNDKKFRSEVANIHIVKKVDQEGGIPDAITGEDRKKIVGYNIALGGIESKKSEDRTQTEKDQAKLYRDSLQQIASKYIVGEEYVAPNDQKQTLAEIPAGIKEYVDKYVGQKPKKKAKTGTPPVSADVQGEEQETTLTQEQALSNYKQAKADRDAKLGTAGQAEIDALNQKVDEAKKVVDGFVKKPESAKVGSEDTSSTDSTKALDDSSEVDLDIKINAGTDTNTPFSTEDEAGIDSTLKELHQQPHIKEGLKNRDFTKASLKNTLKVKLYDAKYGTDFYSQIKSGEITDRQGINRIKKDFAERTASKEEKAKAKSKKTATTVAKDITAPKKSTEKTSTKNTIDGTHKQTKNEKVSDEITEDFTLREDFGRDYSTDTKSSEAKERKTRITNLYKNNYGLTKGRNKEIFSQSLETMKANDPDNTYVTTAEELKSVLEAHKEALMRDNNLKTDAEFNAFVKDLQENTNGIQLTLPGIDGNPIAYIYANEKIGKGGIVIHEATHLANEINLQTAEGVKFITDLHALLLEDPHWYVNEKARIDEAYGYDEYSEEFVDELIAGAVERKFIEIQETGKTPSQEDSVVDAMLNQYARTVLGGTDINTSYSQQKKKYTFKAANVKKDVKVELKDTIALNRLKSTLKKHLLAAKEKKGRAAASIFKELSPENYTNIVLSFFNDIKIDPTVENNLDSLANSVRQAVASQNQKEGTPGVVVEEELIGEDFLKRASENQEIANQALTPLWDVDSPFKVIRIERMSAWNNRSPLAFEVDDESKIDGALNAAGVAIRKKHWSEANVESYPEDWVFNEEAGYADFNKDGLDMIPNATQWQKENTSKEMVEQLNDANKEKIHTDETMADLIQFGLNHPATQEERLYTDEQLKNKKLVKAIKDRKKNREWNSNQAQQKKGKWVTSDHKFDRDNRLYPTARYNDIGDKDRKSVMYAPIEDRRAVSTKQLDDMYFAAQVMYKYGGDTIEENVDSAKKNWEDTWSKWAADPEGTISEWYNDEESYIFISTLIEISRIEANPDYKSGLMSHWDASTSGMQIISLQIKSQKGMELSNVADNDTPQDGYNFVGKGIQDLYGEPHASEIDFMEDISRNLSNLQDDVDNTANDREGFKKKAGETDKEHKKRKEKLKQIKKANFLVAANARQKYIHDQTYVRKLEKSEILKLKELVAQLDKDIESGIDNKSIGVALAAKASIELDARYIESVGATAYITEIANTIESFNTDLRNLKFSDLNAEDRKEASKDIKKDRKSFIESKHFASVESNIKDAYQVFVRTPAFTSSLRSFSKSPVMTLIYGAKAPKISENLMRDFGLSTEHLNEQYTFNFAADALKVIAKELPEVNTYMRTLQSFVLWLANPKKGGGVTAKYIAPVNGFPFDADRRVFITDSERKYKSNLVYTGESDTIDTRETGSYKGKKIYNPRVGAPTKELNRNDIKTAIVAIFVQLIDSQLVSYIKKNADFTVRTTHDSFATLIQNVEALKKLLGKGYSDIINHNGDLLTDFIKYNLDINRDSIVDTGKKNSRDTVEYWMNRFDIGTGNRAEVTKAKYPFAKPKVKKDVQLNMFDPTTSSFTEENVEYNIESDPYADADVSALILKAREEEPSWYDPTDWGRRIVTPSSIAWKGLTYGLPENVDHESITKQYALDSQEYKVRSTNVRGLVYKAEKKLQKAGYKKTRFGSPLQADSGVTFRGNKLNVADAVQAIVNGEANARIDDVKGIGREALAKFAQEPAIASYIKNLTAEGILQKKDDYANSNPTYDLSKYINEDLYKKTYTESIDLMNKNILEPSIFSKIKAIKGEKFASALEHSMYLMTHGKTKSTLNNGLVTDQASKWMLGAVGTTMFFNFRSAGLQFISFANYAFESDNPGQFFKFFANFANPQVWSLIKELFIHPFLKERRARAGFGYLENQLADTVAGSKDFTGLTNKLLRFGFFFTSIMDSVAIAVGGASYVKVRMDAGDSKAEALLKWQEATEGAQQSSRPDQVSQMQTEGAGKWILAYANTPMQYFRLSRNAALDIKKAIKSGKDVKATVAKSMAKIAYYMAIQNLIFTSLQSASSALFGFGDDDDDQEEKDMLNSMAGSILRGMGMYGAMFDALKNVIVQADKESNKARPEYINALLKAFSIAPPLNTKVSQGAQIARAFNWDEDDKWVTAAAKGSTIFLNLPGDWTQKKFNALMAWWSEDYTTWQKILMSGGYSPYQFNKGDLEGKIDFGDSGFGDGDFGFDDGFEIKF